MLTEALLVEVGGGSVSEHISIGRGVQPVARKIGMAAKSRGRGR